MVRRTASARERNAFSPPRKDDDEFLPAGPAGDVFLAHAGGQFVRDPLKARSPTSWPKVSLTA